MGVKGNARLHSGGTNGREGTMEMWTHLVVNVHDTRPHFGKRLNEFQGIHNHKVDIQRLPAYRTNSLKDRETKRKIRNKDPIHHVYMQPIGITLVNHLHRFLKVQEVCTQ